jgi:polyisoprenoid-binding protein YceI
MTTTVPTWTLDPVHSSVSFSLDYMGISTYRTGFRALEGSVAFDPARPEESSVSASIPVASVDVTNDRLMSRLMEADLLGGTDHPTATFRSTRVEVLDPAHWRVAGDLTIHGMTRPVVLDTRYLGQAKSPFSGKTAAAFRAETSIDRREFGVTWNAAMDTGAAYLGERVRIALDIMAVRQD